MADYKFNPMGLSSTEARKLQERYGKNELVYKKKDNLFRKVCHTICEPMFLLLLIASIIYFLLSEPGDGIVMLIFVLSMISIDVIQGWKTDKTLNALKELSAPHITVVRDGKETAILSVDLVPGDLMLLYEGVKIPADGRIVKCNDLCVDESTLTGESEAVWKVLIEDENKEKFYWRMDYCYAGTIVTQGTATVLVEKIGVMTEYGKIGADVSFAPTEATPLQKQTSHLVKVCAGIAVVLFLLVGVLTYLNIPDHILIPRIIESVLSGVTLAMAMIPEEFPVILTVFLSMGAFRLAKKQSLVRKLPSVETLGAISVLCVDKTGTITMNQMTVQEVWAFNKDIDSLVEVMGLACETDAYDPMEKAMLRYCNGRGFTNENLFCGELMKEYAFTNELRMMGHVWRRDGDIVIATKGSPERILSICNLENSDREYIEEKITAMAKEGLRVIGVATAHMNNKEEIPMMLTDSTMEFLGLIGLSDPPRECVKTDIAICKQAGIRIIMITGDNGITAKTIAKKIGMDHSDHIITGDMINEMSDEELREMVKDVNIFSRVVPKHKMRIVKALKENGDIVAMTGDGVNDAPALKYADIGIAMGKRGSEVAREAADLILLDDNFTTIVETIKDGRRIYDNIRQAVGYVLTIHIPIAFASLLAPLLGIAPTSILLLPLHVVLLELIIDPTCSIVLERRPAEMNIMNRNPRDTHKKLLSTKLFLKSIAQGLVIFGASFCTYIYVLHSNEGNAPLARAMGLTIIILSNLFLVQVNSSNYDYVFQSMKKMMKDKVMWAVNMITIMGVILMLYSPIHHFLKFEPLSCLQFLSAILIAAVSVIWYEVVKFFKHKNLM